MVVAKVTGGCSFDVFDPVFMLTGLDIGVCAIASCSLPATVSGLFSGGFC